MRTLHLSLTGTLILMLGGTAMVVAAEPDQPVAGGEPVVVTGTLECLGEAPASSESTAAEAAGDGVVNLHRWVASDPRLEGEVSYTGTLAALRGAGRGHRRPGGDGRRHLHDRERRRLVALRGIADRGTAVHRGRPAHPRLRRLR